MMWKTTHRMEAEITGSARLISAETLGIIVDAEALDLQGKRTD